MMLLGLEEGGNENSFVNGGRNMGPAWAQPNRIVRHKGFNVSSRGEPSDPQTLDL